MQGDFCVICSNLKIFLMEKTEKIVKYSQNWRFFNFVWLLAKIDYFQILAINEDFSKFGQNWWFLKFWTNLKIIQILVKMEDI